MAHAYTPSDIDLIMAMPCLGGYKALSTENSTCGITIRNDIGANMPIVDPDMAHAFEFPEYPDIIPAHMMLADLKSKELFVGQRFVSKNTYVTAVKRYNMKVLVDYRVVDSKLMISKGLIFMIRHSSAPWRSIYCIRHIAVNFHKEFKNVDWRKQVVNMATFYRLTTLMPRMGIKQVNQMNTGYVYVETVRKMMEVNGQRARTMNV
ncbi:hypothetical protein J1N35_028718 [Gossypium stocksii]|uniref:Uncharacterized protein n=1 Tax=Gossypium stocksii TaxID=47602 RepID=A0A9D3UWR9_9ROSI|nr:hypothetical protein J1N35_028718 [Gossypium stocksii]